MEDPKHVGRDLLIEFVEVDRVLEHAGQGVAGGLALEESLAGEHFVEQYAEGPDIRALVDRLSTRLLWRHIGSGAHDRAGLGHGLRDRR